MAEQIFLGVLGLCAGFTVASGMVGLIIGLSIVPRYAGITRTADKILLYEDFTMLGATLGNMAMVFQWHLPGGQVLAYSREYLWEAGFWRWRRWRKSFQFWPGE